MKRSFGWNTTVGRAGRPVLLVLALALAACSSGDEDPVSTAPCSSMEFAESLATPAAGDVFIEDLGTIYSTCSTIDIQVIVNDLTDIWTVGFDLTFPDQLVRYDGYTLGPLLQQGTYVNQPFVQVNRSGGTLQVTATRLPPDPSVDAVGRQVLMVFRFSRLTPGAASIDFDLSGSSTVSDVIQNASGVVRPASFGPGHGGLLTVPM